jgi:3D (Asp-Asp-Asp) domain-containing protein
MTALLSQPTYGTQPLPAASSLLAASGQPAPAPYYGGATTQNASNAAYPAYGSGYGSSNGDSDSDNDPYGANALNATAAYGNPVYPPSNSASYAAGSNGSGKGNGTMSYALSPAPAPYSQSPSSYSQTPPAQTAQVPASYTPSGTSPSLRKTQMYGQTLTNWQPALPVSPWGTPEKNPVIGGGVETETILRSDLRKLKSSRFKGWTYFVVLLGLSGTAAYFGLGDRRELVSEKEAANARFGQLERVHRETLARTREEAGAAAPAGASKSPTTGTTATGTTGTTTPSAAATTAAGVAAVAGPATTKLADELKRAMTGARDVTIETRGDRVIVSIDTASLFSGREIDVGLGGYRTVYRLGKSLKGLKDRRIAILVPSAEMKRVKNVWALAAGRGVALGRLFTDDLGFDRARVLVSVPPPKPGLKGKLAAKVVPQGRIEFALETI